MLEFGEEVVKVGIPFHDVASIFPAMSSEEYARLRDDIRENGQHEPITTYQGSIVDGRNRYNACLDLGIEPVFREWDGRGSLVAFVISLNLHRRHLNESQRAMVAAKIANLGEGRPNETTQICVVSQPNAADLLNVSVRSVSSARHVLTEGAPELREAVESGQVAVSTASVLAGLPEGEQVELVARGAKEIVDTARQLLREQREQRQARRTYEQQPVPVGRHEVIYVDPPWRYQFAESESRAIENQYPTMELEEICALPVADLAADDAMLFLWATSPKVAEALQVMTAWGFEYRTCMVWVKDRIGMGYYARQQHELLLIGRRGNPPLPAPTDRPSSVIMAPRGEHSAKPEEVYGILERMYPGRARVELFARGQRDGWQCWGNQAG